MVVNHVLNRMILQVGLNICVRVFAKSLKVMYILA